MRTSVKLWADPFGNPIRRRVCPTTPTLSARTKPRCLRSMQFQCSRVAKAFLDAGENHDKILDLESDNRYAVSGKAYLHAFWVEHGMEASLSRCTGLATKLQRRYPQTLSVTPFCRSGNQDYASGNHRRRSCETMAVFPTALVCTRSAYQRQGKIRLARENFRKA